MDVSRRAVLSAACATLAGGREIELRPRPPDCPAEVGPTGKFRLGFTGDVMLGRNVDDRWDDAPAGAMWHSLASRLRALDGLFVNLECCLSTRGERQPNRGYYFRADPSWAVPALQAGGVTWASLANNHLLDFGPVALRDTLEALSDGDVAHAGAGVTVDAAIEPSVVDIDGLTVAALAFTDQAPLYAAGPERPGVAHVALNHQRAGTRRLVGEALRRARAADPDLIVASLHWGPNWTVRPAATQRSFARWLIDHGVDVIHGHSAHVIQGVEVYRGRPIIYDAGDFVDDYVVKPALHNDRSFLFTLEIDAGRLDALRLVPVEIANEGVHEASDDAARWLRDRMRRLSEPFGTTVRRAGRGLRIPLVC